MSRTRSSDTIGIPGISYGLRDSFDIQTGSGGGGSARSGGDAGSALSINAAYLRLASAGSISMNGRNGEFDISGLGAGGGSGGGIVLAGDVVHILGSLSANGGNGGVGTQSNNDGGKVCVWVCVCLCVCHVINLMS